MPNQDPHTNRNNDYIKNFLYICGALCLLGIGYYYGIDLPRRQNEKLKQEASQELLLNQQQQNFSECSKRQWAAFYDVMSKNNVSDKALMDMQKIMEKKIATECN